MNRKEEKKICLRQTPTFQRYEFNQSYVNSNNCTQLQNRHTPILYIRLCQTFATKADYLVPQKDSRMYQLYLNKKKKFQREKLHALATRKKKRSNCDPIIGHHQKDQYKFKSPMIPSIPPHKMFTCLLFFFSSVFFLSFFL